MTITYLGHSCILLQCLGGIQILVDPFISGNPLAATIDIHTLMPNYLLITHAHLDHVLDVLPIAKQSGAKIISNYEIVTYYKNQGFDGFEMNTGGSLALDSVKVSSVVAQHSSSFADGTYGGNPNGYVVETENKTIYIAGDTSLSTEMKIIPQWFGPISLGVFPIGGRFTMDAQQAALAATWVETKDVLGVHYDTFPPIEIETAVAEQAFEKKGVRLLLPNIGESIAI